ncbi:MAG TPA: DUF4097 family beta strand repeat-containing protein [Gaiellaceae bacterium]|jgi:DUF4097 and DUF4098 domain-containing protein YvlB|nr:DUF4097 family beta strand repeat-containing protein [Gaiellaceae bacterium]
MPVFETPGPVSLHVRLSSGRVVVTTHDELRTQVELVPLGRRGREAVADVAVTADERAGRHVVTIEQEDRIRWGPLRISLGSVEVRIACPQGADLDLTGGSTDLWVEGELGTVRVRTASGDVHLDRVRGELEARTASGDVRVRETAGETSLLSVSGDLSVAAHSSSLTARTVSGDVAVGTVRAPLTVGTTSGEVELEAVEAGEVRVQTVSGDVRIGVAGGTRVWIDAASVSGELASELDVEDTLPAEAPGAAVPVHVKTVSGDVALTRATLSSRA